MMKYIAFYLPQYHPVKENNEWWGEGFTEWFNVAKSKPRFKGHHQPHIPTTMGFYDLRVPETRERQAQLAHEYGIDGFCYYHYWFNGHLLLEKPLEAVLEDNKPELPFCICWANENWTRAWDGMEREVLIKQDYTEEDSVEHFNYLLPFLKDNRYIKIDDKPVFLLYRYDHIPDIDNFIHTWNQMAVKNGLNGIYFICVKNGFVTANYDEIFTHQFDAVVDFQPNRADFPSIKTKEQFLVDAARKLLPDTIFQYLKRNASAVNKISYKHMVENIVHSYATKPGKVIPAIFPSWDNSARRATPTVIQNDEASVFGYWLDEASKFSSNNGLSEKVVFINAWNEWAEGCHLEPDLQNGTAFLEQVKQVKCKYE
ncbi:glycosyl hydrolase [Pseudocitrobacter sp. RIT415]|nr:glycosyl hydrolase [Pseudocitrobacter sp. RIT 415]